MKEMTLLKSRKLNYSFTFCAKFYSYRLVLVEDEPHAKKTVSKSRGGEEASQLKQCESLVQELSENKDAWPFARPVTKREVS